MVREIVQDAHFSSRFRSCSTGGVFESSLAHFGSLLANFGPLLDPFWFFVCSFGSLLAPFWFTLVLSDTFFHQMNVLYINIAFCFFAPDSAKHPRNNLEIFYPKGAPSLAPPLLPGPQREP